jgi:regulator of sigma E protease
MTVLAFITAIAILVVVHEWGHYAAARACGVKVLRFAVGFGPVLLSLRPARSDTEFVLCALPLGGYVRMLDSREAPVEPAQREQAFDARPLWQRSVIVAGGPLANLVLAVLLVAGLNWVGVTETAARMGTPVLGSPVERAGLRAGDRIEEVCRGEHCQPIESWPQLRWAVTQALLDGDTLRLSVMSEGERRPRAVSLPTTGLSAGEVDAQVLSRLGWVGPYSEPVIGRVQPGGPAEAAGLRTGDRVLRIDGRLVTDATDLRERIRRSIEAGQPVPMTWLIERGAQTLELTVTARPQAAAGEGPATGRIDAYVGAPPETVVVRRGPLEGLAEGVQRTVDLSWLSLRMLGRMLIGEASLKNLSGPLTIADYAGQSAQLGVAAFVGFLALVSVSLGVLNLLPLPMLDGGHLLYHLFEWVTGRPVPDVWLERLQRAGLFILLMLMALALSNDLARLFGS